MAPWCWKRKVSSRRAPVKRINQFVPVLWTARRSSHVRVPPNWQAALPRGLTDHALHPSVMTCQPKVAQDEGNLGREKTMCRHLTRAWRVGHTPPSFRILSPAVESAEVDLMVSF